jgi:hypothetical protein
MSKILHAVRILHDNPTATRNELIGILMAHLPMSKAGATTYYYNATKIIQTKAPEKAPAKEKKIEEIKAKNLETIKKVSAKISKFEKQDQEVRKQLQNDMEEFSKEDPREFVPAFILKKMDQYVE